MPTGSKETILPAFPVALVIAKDVSIKFTSESGVSASFAEAVEKQASKGGGFLCLSSNSSSASSDSKSAAVANSNSNAVTVRFTAPQILGYYMQAIPEDKSVHITETEGNDMSIVGFISNFKMHLCSPVWMQFVTTALMNTKHYLDGIFPKKNF